MVTGCKTPPPVHRSARPSVRPATPQEWADAVGPTFETVTRTVTLGSGSGVSIGSGTTPEGEQWRATITFGNPTFACVYVGSLDTAAGSCVFPTLLTPASHVVNSAGSEDQFVIAVAPSPDLVLLSITDANGGVTVYSAVAIDDANAAIAALLPVGATYELIHEIGRAHV